MEWDWSCVQHNIFYKGPTKNLAFDFEEKTKYCILNGLGLKPVFFFL